MTNLKNNNDDLPSSRIPLIDELRGIAVLLMAVFHFCYDLSVFNFIPFEMNGGFYTWFRFLIVTLFFLSVGASLYLGHAPKIKWGKFWFRELKIFVGALIISISTFIMYPSSWVWFGVLHFIVVSSIITLPFLKIPTLAALIGVAIFVLHNITDWFNLSFAHTLLADTLHLPPGTQDLTRLIPWLGMVLIGVYFGKMRFWGLRSIAVSFVKKPISWLGQHSLIFYLVHQPPLFALAWLLNKFMH